MSNQNFHPMSVPTWNLIKPIGKQVKNTSWKSSFSFFPLKFDDVIKSYFFPLLFYNFLRRPILDLKIPLMDRDYPHHANASFQWCMVIFIIDEFLLPISVTYDSNKVTEIYFLLIMIVIEFRFIYISRFLWWCQPWGMIHHFWSKKVKNNNNNNKTTFSTCIFNLSP